MNTGIVEKILKTEKNEMVAIVIQRLKQTDLALRNPEVVARNLLSYYDYDLDKVLELAV